LASKLAAEFKSLTALEACSELNPAQKLAILNYQSVTEMIPRDQVKAYTDKITSALTEFDVFAVGPYRLGNTESPNIDVIIISNANLSISNALQAMHDAGIDCHEIKSTDLSFQGLCKLPDMPLRNISIHLASKDSLYAGLVLKTGNDEFLKVVHDAAMQVGFTLTESGLKDTKNQIVEVNSEKEIFEKIDLDWHEPETRNW
jgi:DNA polymerase/3'-5' exonuclease PolX